MKNKNEIVKKAGVATKLFLTGAIALGTIYSLGCGDNGDGTTQIEQEQDFGLFEGIQVRGSADADDTKVQGKLDILQDMYDNVWSVGELGNFMSRVTQIYMKPGTGSNFSGGILTICYDDNMGVIGPLINTIIALMQQENGFMLADLNKYLKKSKGLQAQRAVKMVRIRNS